MSRTFWRLAASGTLLAGALAACPAAGAAPLRLDLPEHGAASAGSSLTVSWGSEALRDDVDEAELILSLDGGRTWPVRLTRDLHLTSSSVTFRIPSLPATEARLGLRTGRAGEPESETIRAVSRPFEIAIAVRAAPAEPLARIAGEWRTPEAVDPADRPGPPAEPRTEGNGNIAPLGELTDAALDQEAEPLLPPAEGQVPIASAGSRFFPPAGLCGLSPLLVSRRE